MRIAGFEIEPWETEPFEQLEKDNEVTLVEEPLTKENADAYRHAEVVSTFIESDLTADVLGRFEALKLIATRSTGFDHIDVEFCSSHGIAVCNVPEYGANTVAEHVFGLLLTIAHNLDRAIDRTRKGDFSSKGLQGFDLHGKTFGVIGTGDIGKAAASIARGFDMRVLAYDVKPDERAAETAGFDYVDLDDLLAQSDIITVHVPGSDRTRNLISGEQFDKMKTGVVIINTSRGEVVSIRALVRAIAERKVAGAGLDVLPEEPVIREEAELLRSVYEDRHNLETLLANHVLLHLRNVVVTPHSAFNTREAIGRILDTTVANIERFAVGEPQNLVITG